jgi:hypothetical protein
MSDYFDSEELEWQAAEAEAEYERMMEDEHSQETD